MPLNNTRKNISDYPHNFPPQVIKFAGLNPLSNTVSQKDPEPATNREQSNLFELPRCEPTAEARRGKDTQRLDQVQNDRHSFMGDFADRHIISDIEGISETDRNALRNETHS